MAYLLSVLYLIRYNTDKLVKCLWLSIRCKSDKSSLVYFRFAYHLYGSIKPFVCV